MSRFKQLKSQRGMVEAGLLVVLVAVVIIAGVFYMRTKNSLESKTPASTSTTTATSKVTTKDPALDQAADGADSSVNDLNSSYTSDTSSSSLNVTQGAL